MNKRLRPQLIALCALALAGCATTGPGPVPAPPPSPAARAALAPGGVLRIGVQPGSPMSLLRNRLTGSAHGLVHDLGAALAERLGVGLKLVEYRTPGEVHAALKAGQIDFAGHVIAPVRAAEVDFAAPLIEVEHGFLVAAKSPVQSGADMQRMGFRIGVLSGSSSQTTLPRLMPNAVVLPASTPRSGADALAHGEVDAFASNKMVLLEMADGLPGARVLAENWGAERWAPAIPKGRDAGLRYLNEFLSYARASGKVAAALQSAGLRGVNIVEPQ